MLQADEIIQQKEWQQLSDAEKAAIAELAGNEQEFNLLKKMLMVSAEAVDEVPVVSRAVQQNIKEALPVVKRSGAYKFWYAAAAVLIAVTVGAVFILNKQETPGYVSKPQIKKTQVLPATKEPGVPQRDSDIILVQKEIKTVTPKKILPVPKPLFPSLNDTMHPQPVYTMLDTRVADDPALMEFITEVE